MSNIGKDKLVFDPAAGLNDNDLVGSYTLAADGTKITKTTVSGKDGLDVNVINASIAVTATNLDVRDLVFATDKVDVSGSTIALDSTTLAALESITVQNGSGAAAVNIQDGGNSITIDGTVAATQSGTWTIDSITNAVTVSATNLDIRDLAFATDKVDVSGSTIALDATTLAALENITVSATDLDIRNLDYSQDNVAIKGATGNQLVVNADGSINVQADISVVTGAEKAEDAAHTSGDIGQFILAVRHDADTSMVNADGDYAPLQVNSSGALKVAGTFTQSLPSSGAYSSITVGTSAVALPASPLANRKKIMIQNLGSKPLYIGTNSSVTAADGLRIAAGANVELDWGPSLTVYGISTAAGQDIRVLEVA